MSRNILNQLPTDLTAATSDLRFIVWSPSANALFQVIPLHDKISQLCHLKWTINLAFAEFYSPKFVLGCFHQETVWTH